MSGRRSIGARIVRDGVRLAGTGTRIPPEMAFPGLRMAESPKNGSRAIPTAQQAVLERLSERQFQAIVVAALRQRGWIVWTVPNMRQTTAGLPDVVAIHAGHDVALMWELKGARTRVTDLQRAVIEVLRANPGIDARIVRPSDFEALRDALDAAVPIAALNALPREDDQHA